VASTQPAPPADRTGRLALVTLTAGGMVMLVWLIATLTAAAFG
jgi:hypothetical protein